MIRFSVYQYADSACACVLVTYARGVQLDLSTHTNTFFIEKLNARTHTHTRTHTSGGSTGGELIGLEPPKFELAPKFVQAIIGLQK